MDHVAILRKSNIKKGDNLLKDIIDGKKTVESRWYVNKTVPWNKIKIGDTVYLKESGCLVTAKAQVKNVIQYENLNDILVTEIINKYGKLIAPEMSAHDFFSWWKNQVNKRYLILVFLENVESITPFDIDKKGFGVSAAWLTLKNIGDIKR